jgi:hypothetical protein
MTTTNHLLTDSVDRCPAAMDDDMKAMGQHRLPSELWATIFGYAVPVGAGLEPNQISQFRLLSRSITAGLDEWTVEGIEQMIKRDGTLRLVPMDARQSAIQL